MKKNITYLIFIFSLIAFNKNLLADYPDAFEDYNLGNWEAAHEKCIDSNDDRCLNLLGILYYKGLGIDIDYKKSIDYFTKSEKMGNTKAMINLGFIYMQSRENKLDLDKAAKYFNKAYQDKSIYKNASEESSLIASDQNLLGLKNNTILAKYNIFYSHYLKFMALEKSNFGKSIITQKLSDLVNNKYLIIKDELSNLSLDIDTINSQIYDEQNILLKLYISDLKVNQNRFQNELNNVISFIKEFNF